METPAYHQRLGKRRALDVPLDATWPVARKARLRTRINQETVRIVNVSPTGAGESPTEKVRTEPMTFLP